MCVWHIRNVRVARRASRDAYGQAPATKRSIWPRRALEAAAAVSALQPPRPLSTAASSGAPGQAVRAATAAVAAGARAWVSLAPPTAVRQVLAHAPEPPSQRFELPQLVFGPAVLIDLPALSVCWRPPTARLGVAANEMPATPSP